VEGSGQRARGARALPLPRQRIHAERGIGNPRGRRRRRRRRACASCVSCGWGVRCWIGEGWRCARWGVANGIFGSEGLEEGGERTGGKEREEWERMGEDAGGWLLLGVLLLDSCRVASSPRRAGSAADREWWCGTGVRRGLVGGRTGAACASNVRPEPGSRQRDGVGRGRSGGLRESHAT
jgi:hypothetical protein